MKLGPELFHDIAIGRQSVAGIDEKGSLPDICRPGVVLFVLAESGTGHRLETGGRDRPQ